MYFVEPSAARALTVSHVAAMAHATSLPPGDSVKVSAGDLVMISSPANTAARLPDGSEKRRGTRLMIEVPITVMGMDTLGEPFKESTITTAISCYGCKYRTKRYAAKDSMVTLEIRRPGLPNASRIVHARVIWVQRPRHHRETFQIGLELEKYGNVWGIDSPPADWFPLPDDPILMPPKPVEPEPLLLEPVSAGGDAEAKVAHATDWEVLHLPQGDHGPLPAAAAFEQELTPQTMREIVNEVVKQTTEAIIAEEIALLQKYFTSRLETALLESLGSFSSLSADIVAQTRASCLESAKEVEAELRKITQQAADMFLDPPPKKPRASKRKK
jgi:hypothetical protein